MTGPCSASFTLVTKPVVFVEDVGLINIMFELLLSLCSGVKQESVINKALNKQEIQTVNTE